ncbi:MAG: hypothetical protein HY554_01295 [Elusimicrobia bacterium]|nr:hypothetical protein [Elusimicrobiota bacterium]
MLASVALVAALAALLGPAALPARAAVLRLEAYDAEGKPLAGPDLLAHIAARSGAGAAGAARSGIYVTDLGDAPVPGRPWLVAGATQTWLAWEDASRVRVSLPWPVLEDGFSTVFLDNGGAGYADGDAVLLNEAIAETQHRLFKESLDERLASWEPNYRPSAKSRELIEQAHAAVAKARKEQAPDRRAAAYEKALARISAAWAKALFEHGGQVAAHPKLGPALRWGLTLDETLPSRLADFERVAEDIRRSGANWVRLVFRANPEDFVYGNVRSFLEYDAAVKELTARKLHIMGSVLDSTQWTRSATAAQAAARTRNIVLRYQDRIRSWEVASEPNGDWLGGRKAPHPEELVRRALSESAAEVKRIDPTLETVATLYWWEGTARDDRHPTFAWLKDAEPQGLFAKVDVVALSVYPDEHPMGMAFDTVFRKLHARLPDKRLMLGGFGYVEGKELEGYWWLDPSDVDGARKDLLILFTGAAAATPRPLGGGFWWPTLSTMLNGRSDGESLARIYRRTLERLGR